MDEKVKWSTLPSELWPKIGRSLENHIDVLRFRSVCKTWRSSISPSHPKSPFPLQIPHPLYPSLETHLYQATLYRIEPSDASSNPKLQPLAPCSSFKGWLIKVEESKDLPLHLLNPISDRKIKHPLWISPKLWNLLDYRVIELCKSYKIQCTRRFSTSIKKIVFFPNSSWIGMENAVACCIFQEGKLGLMKYGDEKWTLVDENNFYYDDIIVYKGQFYVTDKWGTISWVDISSLMLIQYSPPLCGLGHKKHLVESCGSLYVVDRYCETEPRRRNYPIQPQVINLESSDRDDQAVECFKVYKLDEDWGTWVDVKSLGDRVFILGENCSFSVSAEELIGYQGNCIYFTDIFYMRMYNLEDQSIVTIETDPCIEKSIWPGGHDQYTLI